MMKLGMIKLVVLLTICGGCFAGTFDANFSCVACSIPCTNSKCYKISAPNFNQEYCGSSNCGFEKSYKLTFGPCTYDMVGSSCPTGVCVLPEAKDCASTILGLNSCSQPQSWYQVSCQSCTNTPSCQKCLLMQQSPSTSTEICLGTSCNSMQTLNVSLFPCPSKLDYNGNSCDCCYSLISQYTSRPGICTSKFGLYSKSQFNAYAQKTVLFGWTWTGLGAILGVLFGLGAI